MDEVDEMITGVSSSAEDEDGLQRPAEIKGECFVRIHNATTGRDLQVFLRANGDGSRVCVFVWACAV